MSAFDCGSPVTDFLSLPHPPVFTPAALDGHQCVPDVFEIAPGALSVCLLGVQTLCLKPKSAETARAENPREIHVTHHMRSP